ncbi:pilin [Pseudoxanthomonas dokdonensis]|uniref:GYF domain-containing protein n=1 Tax=Pseudoxanthomonas dokdonensis TaxID=344882 RepID=A0A0R0CIE0_9GAMM|nr:pilin [Pseudoxanthomonas dokdonensis]KRG69349.1 hypothetical protein ABB29_09610 [Pseudoxanthomonas dokdonensis]
MSSASATEWYYLDQQQRQCGPVTALALVREFHARALNLDSPVWRDGMPHWQPLRQRLGELGLPEAVANRPPPLPGTPPPLPSGIGARASAQLRAAPPTRPAAAGHHPAMHAENRTLLWVIVGIACALGLLMLLGILAAIALPAYQEYTLRARTAAAITVAPALQSRVESYYRQHQRCPGNESPGFPAADTALGSVASVQIGRFDNGHCGFELRLGEQRSEHLDGKALWFDLDHASGQWTCSSEIENRYLPARCRTP